EGALVIFSDEVTGPEGKPALLMVRKRDGGYGYDTTDLATIRYRIHDLKADRLLYVTDSRQALHFQLIFEAARRAGWLTDDIDAAHVPYGTVLGPDGRPFKTRSGGTVRLMDLLDDAVNRAREVVREKNPDLPREELDRIAEQAGVGAVKYADLSTSRIKDYVFDVDRMVSFTGNTGVYLQYAHTRIRSILRKAGDPQVSVDPSIALHPAERALALELDDFGPTLAAVAETLEPHKLCGYLYDLARDFTTFYEACPVLNAEEPVLSNRLSLCRLTAHTLREGLGLLGISAPERMCRCSRDTRRAGGPPRSPPSSSRAWPSTKAGRDVSPGFGGRQHDVETRPGPRCVPEVSTVRRRRARWLLVEPFDQRLLHTEDRVADVQLRVTLDEDVRDQRAQILRGLLLRVDRRVASRRGSRRRARWPDWCCSPVATSERLRPRCPRTTACVGYLPCCAASSTTRGCRSTGWRRR